jgi:3-deoxy-manno-octulosonate cytidylyltransferase (CMP-KDO synthetase)
MLYSYMRTCIIIPARYASSRFPGKPLVTILDKPMILWVAELSSRALRKEHVYIATEDRRIADIVRSEGFSVLMTSRDALTGTDRLAEASLMVDYDIYINVQGDEPLIDPEDISRCIELKKTYPDAVINGFCWIGSEEDPASKNIPKVITNEEGQLIYMSRMPLPGYKETAKAPLHYKKQVCIYGFTRKQLRSFLVFGRKSYLEQSEDIEILRFFELGYRILMYECRSGSLAVDVPEDIPKVEEALRRALML